MDPVAHGRYGHFTHRLVCRAPDLARLVTPVVPGSRLSRAPIEARLVTQGGLLNEAEAAACRLVQFLACIGGRSWM